MNNKNNMASRTKKSTTNQGPRLKGASTKGKVAGVPMKPKIAAKIKNSQGIGGGLNQSKGGAKYVTKAKGTGATGIRQSGTGAKKPSATKVGVNKLNKSPMKAQPKSPKNNQVQPKNNFTLHNTVTKGDVSRIRKAHNLATPPMVGGGFKGFIGSK